MSNQIREAGLEPAGNQGAQGQSQNAGAQERGQDRRDDRRRQEAPMSAESVLSRLAAASGVTATSNAVSGNVTKVIEVLKTIQQRTENKAGVLKIGLLPIEDVRLKISAVVLFTRTQNTVVYSALLLESIGKELLAREETLPGGRKVLVDQTTSQYWDGRMRQISEEILVAANPDFGGLELICAADIVVPKLVNLENEDTLARFFDNANGAILAYVRSLNGQPSSNITADLLSAESVQVKDKFDITPGAIYESTSGLPLAGDFNVVMYVGPRNNTAAQSIHDTESEIALTSLVGYVDFMYRGDQALVQNPGGRPTPGYDPVIVITQNTVLGRSTMNDSVLSMLLALPSIMPLIDSRSRLWTTVFDPYQVEGSAKTSIGVLGLEHNPFPGAQWEPKVLDVVSSTDPQSGAGRYTAQQVAELYCSDTVIVAMDITLGGPLEWVQRLLAEATPGSDNEALLINELDAFSNGIFSQIWLPKKEPILSAPSTTLHAGYLVDNDKKLRDIRSIDYASVLELTSGDQSAFSPFAQGFLPGTDSKLAMDNKRNILKSLSPNIEFTGIHNRIFINTAFIEAIEAMFNECQISVATEGLVDTMGVGLRRASYNSQYFRPVQSQGAFHLGGRPAVAEGPSARYRSGGYDSLGARGRRHPFGGR